MKAIELMGTVDEQGNLLLDGLLEEVRDRRVRVIVLVAEAQDEIDELDRESAADSFRAGWRDVIAGNTVPVSQLWEGMDDN